MSLFLSGEAAVVHSRTPELDDVAVWVGATDDAPGSSLGRVLRVSADGTRASVETPGGVKQAYRGRYGSWTLADGDRTPVRWATRKLPAADTADTAAPAPVLAGYEGDPATWPTTDAPVSRETTPAPVSAYVPWSEADAAASEAAYLAEHPAPASGDGRGVAVWAADGGPVVPAAEETTYLVELHTPTDTSSGPFGWHVTCSCGWRSLRGLPARQLTTARVQHTAHALDALRDAVLRAG